MDRVSFRDETPDAKTQQRQRRTACLTPGRKAAKNGKQQRPEIQETAKAKQRAGAYVWKSCC